jgi:radical SAM protein with 4Fe4S-binding SPASM domain
MYIQENNKAKRKNTNSVFFDIKYLKNYYRANSRFPLFNQVLIETRTDCNQKCKFCPQYYNKKQLGVMSWNIFTTIINQLSEINFSGRLALFLSNEPLLEDRLFNMIEYIRKKNSNIFIDITTNGVLLDEKMITDLFSCGLDNIIINDYRPDREIYPNKISKNLIPIVEKFRFNPKFNYVHRSTNENLSNYAGNTKQNQNSNNSLGFCNFPFRKLTISYKGNVLLCCNDYLYQTNFGNILDKNIIDIWYSDEYNHYRHNLLNNNRIGLCEKCNQIQEYSIY